MLSLIIVASPDADMLPQRELPAPLCLATHNTTRVTLSVNGQAFSTAELAGLSYVLAATSDAGATILSTLKAQIEADTAAPAPDILPLADLDPASRLNAIYSALMGQQERELLAASRRNTDLSRALSELRKTHEKMQGAFHRLEAFIYAQNLAERATAASLPISLGQPRIALTADQPIEQRLPGSSVGLSDIVLYPQDTNSAAKGELHAQLFALEDTSIRAEWRVAGHSITGKTIHLSLATSLDVDAVSLQLRLSWSGPGGLGLHGSMQNPDDRYQAHIAGEPSGQLLALRCQAYPPNCAAPVTLGAYLPGRDAPTAHPSDVATPMVETRAPRSLTLGADTLADAVNLMPHNQNYGFMNEEGALKVHVMDTGISAALVRASVPEGARQVLAEVCTRASKAQNIRYAMAVAPITERSPPGGRLPTFRKSYITEWTVLSPLMLGELRLPLPDALLEAHDLYLLTRLATDPGDPRWGWSTFSKIRFDFE